MIDDEAPKLTIAEFIERCSSMFEELGRMLEQFDDNSDPMGLTDVIVGRCLGFYLAPDQIPDSWKR